MIPDLARIVAWCLFDWLQFNLNTAPEAIEYLRQHPEHIVWTIDMLRENLDRVNWRRLSENPAAIDLLRSNLECIDWEQLSQNAAAIPLLQEYPERIVWWQLAGTLPR